MKNIDFKQLIFLVGALMLAVSTQAASGKWQSLFDGKTLNGWTPNENPESWAVENGAIVARGDRSHLFYQGPVADHDFRNFEFSARVKTLPGANSGIYFHTKLNDDQWPSIGYEAQVYNSNPKNVDGYIEHKKTGSIYGVRNTWRSIVKNNEWFEYRIVVSGKTIRTYINGELVCDYTEPANPWRDEGKNTRSLSSGTFALQAHDPDSVVHYKKIRVRELPDHAPTLGNPITDPKLDELISRLSDQNVALIDFGIDAGKDGKSISDVARFYGVTLGSQYPSAASQLSSITSDNAVLVIVDRDTPPSVVTLKIAKALGMKIAFSSGGVDSLDPTRLKKRLQAITDAGLGWQDIWVP